MCAPLERVNKRELWYWCVPGSGEKEKKRGGDSPVAVLPPHLGPLFWVCVVVSGSVCEPGSGEKRKKGRRRKKSRGDSPVVAVSAPVKAVVVFVVPWALHGSVNERLQCWCASAMDSESEAEGKRRDAYEVFWGNFIFLHKSHFLFTVNVLSVGINKLVELETETSISVSCPRPCLSLFISCSPPLFLPVCNHLKIKGDVLFKLHKLLTSGSMGEYEKMCHVWLCCKEQAPHLDFAAMSPRFFFLPSSSPHMFKHIVNAHRGCLRRQ